MLLLPLLLLPLLLLLLLLWICCLLCALHLFGWLVEASSI
jgi:hypothetical protein